MDFLVNNILLVVISFAVSVAIFYVLQFNQHLLLLFASILNFFSRQKNIKKVFILLGFLFLAFVYLSKPVYYFPFSKGTLGDNYIHMSHAMKKDKYIKHHHPLWPLTGELTIDFAEKIGLLNPNDPMYLEKSFLLGSLPIRLSITVALICTFILFFMIFNSFCFAFLSFLTVGLSYVPLLWGIQSNAQGLGIAMQIFTIFMFGLFYKTKNNFYLILTGMFASLCVFAHNSLGYFAIGIFLAVLVFFLTQLKGISRKEKLLKFLYFFIPVIILAFLYYSLEAYLFKTRNIKLLLERISDRSYFHQYPFFYGFSSIKAFFISLKNLIVITLYNIVNYLDPHNILEKFEILLILTGIITSFLLLLKNLKNIIKRNIVQNPVVMLSVLTYLCIGFGYFVTRAYSGYFSILAVPTLFFGLSLLFIIGQRSDLNKIRVVTILLILNIGLFSYNLFSHRSILQGRDLYSNKFYYEYVVINNYVEDKQQKVLFYTKNLDFNKYGDGAVLSYYKPKFENITRITKFPETLEEFIVEIDKQISKYILVDEYVKDMFGEKIKIMRKIYDNIYVLRTPDA